MKNDELIAKRIMALCSDKNISYYTLAFRSTVPITTLMNIIHGYTRNPGIITILKLCDGLGITVQEFFCDDIFDGVENKA